MAAFQPSVVQEPHCIGFTDNQHAAHFVAHNQEKKFVPSRERTITAVVGGKIINIDIKKEISRGNTGLITIQLAEVLATRIIATGTPLRKNLVDYSLIMRILMQHTNKKDIIVKKCTNPKCIMFTCVPTIKT